MSADRTAYDPWAPPPAEEVAATPVAVPAPQPQPQQRSSDAAAQIPSDLDDISKDDLIALAELADVATYGTKQQIADRIRGAAGQD